MFLTDTETVSLTDVFISAPAHCSSATSSHSCSLVPPCAAGGSSALFYMLTETTAVRTSRVQTCSKL